MVKSSWYWWLIFNQINDMIQTYVCMYICVDYLLLMMMMMIIYMLYWLLVYDDDDDDDIYCALITCLWWWWYWWYILCVKYLFMMMMIIIYTPRWLLVDDNENAVVCIYVLKWYWRYGTYVCVGELMEISNVHTYALITCWWWYWCFKAVDIDDWYWIN